MPDLVVATTALLGAAEALSEVSARVARIAGALSHLPAGQVGRGDVERELAEFSHRWARAARDLDQDCQSAAGDLRRISETFETLERALGRGFAAAPGGP